jgi:hypothetical protein
MPRIYRRPFHDRKDVALHALAAHVGPVPSLAPRDLVDLIQKNDSARFHPFQRDPSHLLHVDQLVLFFLDQILERLVHAHRALLRTASEHSRNHLADVQPHFFQIHVARYFKGGSAVLDFEFDRAFVELSLAKTFPQLLAGLLVVRAVLARGGRHQQIQDAIFSVRLRALGHFLELLAPHHVDRDVHQIADHRLHIASHVPDFGKLARFNFNKRRIGQLSQTSREFRFADARRPDHEDVFRHHLLGHVWREFLAAKAVPQRDGHRAFGVRLADYMFIELLYDLARSQLVQYRTLVHRLRREINHHVSRVPRR